MKPDHPTNGPTRPMTVPARSASSTKYRLVPAMRCRQPRQNRGQIRDPGRTRPRRHGRGLPGKARQP
jgi:hypothetical protein